MKRITALITFAFVAAPSFSHAELWNPLDTKPRPNAIVALDTSVTTAIIPDCASHSCHVPGVPDGNLPLSRSRLWLAQRDIIATLPLFDDYFSFGYFQYEGCGEAHVVPSSRLPPDPNDPSGRLQDILTAVDSARACRTKEARQPSGGGGSNGCLTPNCTNDAAALSQLTSASFPGVNVTAPPSGPPITCDRPQSSRATYNLTLELVAQFASFNWPRWSSFGSGSPTIDVSGTFCNPVAGRLQQIRTELADCLTNPDAYWDMTFLDGAWCDPLSIATNACTTPPLAGSCVCDSTQSGCTSGGIGRTECNTIVTDWPNNIAYVPGGRQQVAVCEAYNPMAGRIGSFMHTQPDNVVNAGCRENVAMFFTDGWVGFTDGVYVEGALARNQGYESSITNESNMYVFRMDNGPMWDPRTWTRSAADGMQVALSQGSRGESLESANRVEMQSSFAEILMRTYGGTYGGSAPTFDSTGSRMALHSFTVPGHDTNSGVGSNYFGWPSRISWHDVADDGTIQSTPIFATDLRTVADAPATCGGGALVASDSDHDPNKIGPGGQFRNGVSRDTLVNPNSTDRNGDGTDDNHAPLHWRGDFSNGASRPVVVDRPREWISGPAGGDFAAFMTDTTVRARPRMIYQQTNGFVVGYHAGAYTTDPAFTSTYGRRARSVGYDESHPDTGRVAFRYKPSWVEETNGVRYRYDLNDLVQQPIMTGDLVAREVFGRFGGVDRFRTILVGNQGRAGRGYFALDITNPCTPNIIAEWQLPIGSYASGTPDIYTVLTTNGVTPALVTSGGAGGAPELYAFDITTGAELFRTALPAPAGRSFPAAPICVDVTGRDSVTHCYAIRDDGAAFRVSVDVTGFGAPVDITPTTITLGARRYTTAPAVYFANDGAVTIVYGSGDFETLTGVAASNVVHKIVDRATRVKGVPAVRADEGRVCISDAGSTSGTFLLGPGERLISAPTVAAGVVSWATYASTTTGCIAGRTQLYAMNFETCADALGSGLRPVAVAVGPGIGASPTLHRPSEALFVGRSSAPDANELASTKLAVRVDAPQDRGRILFWRTAVDLR